MLLCAAAEYIRAIIDEVDMTDADGVPLEVVKAFNGSGDPQRLEGGEGRFYRVGALAFKPVDNIARYKWVAGWLRC